MPKPRLQLSQDPAADKLISAEPLALLIGMVLDQQMSLEWAFKGPLLLQERLGRKLDAADIAAMDEDELVAVFCAKPALHRFPAANARRVQDLCRLVAADYGNKASKVWSTAKTGDELFARVKALPGFGEMKARIFVALLGKQLNVRPDGWAEAAGDYGRPGTFMSVADITDPTTLLKVRAYKQEKKAAAKAAKAPADA